MTAGRARALVAAACLWLMGSAAVHGVDCSPLKTDRATTYTNSIYVV